MFKKIVNQFIVIFMFSFSLLNNAQEIKGKVVDVENGAALSGTHILYLKDNSLVISDKLGEFSIKSYGVYKFTRIGYQSKTVEIISSKYQVIQLNMKISELNEVVVNATQLPVKLKKSMATISIISKEEIKRGNNSNIVPILNNVPGVYMHTGALNTNRITIRGIGSRNLYGTAKIRAYFGDIPLTSGNGETTIEDFELNSISRLEIIKGSISSIYGSGLGGTIHLIPENSYLNSASVNSEFFVGSFGLIKGTVNLNYGDVKNSFRAIYSNTHSDGYRDNNEYNRQTITLNSSHYLGKKDKLSFLGSYVDLKAFIPSSLDEKTFLENPTSAAFTWGRSKGYEDTQRGIFGLSWNHQFSDKIKQITSVFSSFKRAYEPRPFNILSENLFSIGARSRLIGNTKLLKTTFNWTFGAELFIDWLKYKTFENLYANFPVGTGSIEGNQLSNLRESRRYYNLFFESNYNLTNKTVLSLGVNFNKTQYNLNNRVTATNIQNQNETNEFKGVISPKVGILYEFSKKTTFYSSISHGFSTPTVSETLLPNGQINFEIKPETGLTIELGTRGKLIKDRLWFNLALYNMNIQNLLVARRNSEDQFIGVNAGKTEHNGLELSLKYNWFNHNSFSLSSHLNYTLNDFTFKDFIDEDKDYSGNKLTGIPSEVFNSGIDFITDFGLYGNFNFQYFNRIPINDSNDVFSKSYSLTNIKIGYLFKLTNDLKLNTFFGIDNLFDVKYASQLLINAKGFGGRAPRFFYPGLPQNYFLGINIKYNL